MGERKSYTNGTFCWPELCALNADKAKRFYCELLNWKAVDNPMEQGGVYTMFQLKDKDIGAMYEMTAEQKSENIPPNWLAYVSVDNLEETVAKVEKLGGKVIVDVCDLGEPGKMALIADPFGATFGLWKANLNHGANFVNEEGTMCWNELATKDVKKAEAFYCGLFGWTAETKELHMGAYTTFMNGEQMAGGMLQMTEEWGDIPSHWMVYFTMKDIDAQCKKVESMGGKVCVEPMDIPDVGRFAVINDPDGAVLSIIDLINPDE